MIGRLRLWSGYVLLAYVTTHLLNHALGFVSLRSLEEGRFWFLFLWQSLPGQILLYGAMLLHITVAFWALFRRRTLSLSPWEWAQYTLGRLDHSARRAAFRRHPHRLQLFRREERLSVGAGRAGVGRWLEHRPPIRAAAGGLAACLHRPCTSRGVCGPGIATGCRISLRSPCWCRRPASAARASPCAISCSSRSSSPGCSTPSSPRSRRPMTYDRATLSMIADGLTLTATVLLLGCLAGRPPARPVGTPGPASCGSPTATQRWWSRLQVCRCSK